MLRKYLFYIIVCIAFNNVYAANFAKTYFIITNNTNETIHVNADLLTSDNNFNKGQLWDSHAIDIPPYDTEDVLWFRRNIGVKMHHQYQFLLHIKNNNHIDTLQIKTDMTANLIYGSELTTQLLVPGLTGQFILSKNGLEHYPIALWDGDYVLHARSWLPDLCLFNYYHIVIDKPEIHKILTPKNSQLSVLSYNTQLMPFYADTVDDLNQPEVRVVEIPKKITNYDVVILQELFSADLRSKIIFEMSDHYPFHSLVAGANTSKFLTGGIMIFSKWPLEKEDQMVYRAGNGLNSLSAKGVVYAVINKNGKRYHIFGTHLQSGTSDVSKLTRSKQLLELANFIDQSSIPVDESVLIGGDMNIDEYTDEANTIYNTLNVSILKNIGFKYSFDGLTNTMIVSPDRRRIDYVFYQNNHLQPHDAYNRVYVLRNLNYEKMWPQFDLSDHYPVESFFDFS